MNKVILQGNSDKILSINLGDILKLITTPSDYEWKILWITGVSKKECNFNMLDFEKKLNDGYDISFNQLIDLGSKLEQIHQILLIGSKNDLTHVNKNMSDENIKNNSDFFIELIDSSFWEVTSNDKQFIGRLSSLEE